MSGLFRRRKQRKVLVLGLDCASPELVFDQFRDDLPTLSNLMESGTWGILQSSIPCITVPAWSSMLSGVDPGTLGVYGFRNRISTDAYEMAIADSSWVNTPRVWDLLASAGKESLVVNVPQTFPVTPVNGNLVSSFLTPNQGSSFTYPAILKHEILKRQPAYVFDVADFRTSERATLLDKIIAFTNTQYDVFHHLLQTRNWDFAIHVNIGVDRIQHAFWHYHDPEHRHYEPDNPFRNAIRDYYKLVDSWIARILHDLADDVFVLVVSDHGAKRMDGAICINEWLWQNGWLRVKNPPPDREIVAFDDLEIDWSQTRAWSTGGYYGRIFLNVVGREPEGIIPPADYERVRGELAACLKAIPDDNGLPLNNTIYRPEDIYRQTKGVPPDLLVYFGDLYWRAVGSIGHDRHFMLNNDTGMDDANHAQEGMFILSDPRQSGYGKVGDQQLMDVTPTILHHMGVDVPDYVQGRVIT